MKVCVLAVFLLCAAALSFSQPQLIPNPGCSNSAPYCRSQIHLADANHTGVSVIGFHSGILFAWQLSPAGSPCPTQSPVNGSATFCLYSTSTFSPESWTFLGQVSQGSASESAIELVFGSGTCSAYKYLYVSSQRILRATASSSDWSFTDVGSSNLPSVPPDTAARIGSFAIGTNGSGNTRLFYGNYNNHSYNQMTPPYGAYVWHSDNCGSTWVSQFFGGREVHSIEVDPSDSSHIYVNIDIECSPNGTVCPDPTPGGLWHSTDGGNSFSHLSSAFNSGVSVVGIDSAFSNLSKNVFLETDGHGAESSGGPLLYADKSNVGPTQFVAWPNAVASGEPAWAGSASAIKVTSEQNIFLVTNNDFNPARSGAWYFVPPDYGTPIRLEDLAPPISSIVTSNGVATVTTFEPHGFHSSDSVVIYGTSGFDTSTLGVQITQTGSKTFTYACPTCPANGTGGFAQMPFLYWGYHTVEVTDPATNVTYLYNQMQKIAKPRTADEMATILAAIYEIVTN
jgi:hypothetical protein